MSTLTWVATEGYIDNGLLSGALAVKPVFSFAYDALYFEPLGGNKFSTLAGVEYPLTPSDEEEVVSYLNSFSGADLLVRGVDSTGAYLGLVRMGTVSAVVVAPPPNDEHWRYDFSLKNYVHIAGVDQAGNYLGNVPLGTYFADVGSPPPRMDIPMVWDFPNKIWIDSRPAAAIAEEVLTKTKADYVLAVQEHLDTQAKAKGYDSILSACSYAGAANPFQAEGQAFVAWRGNVWDYCYQQFAGVQAGTYPMPTLASLLAALPTSP